MTNNLENLEERLKNWEEREVLIEQAKAVIGSCRRIVLVRTLKEKARQKSLGIDDDNALEIKALRKQMEGYHQDMEDIESHFDVKAFKRVFTEYEEFSQKFKHEVLQHGLKNQQIKRNRGDFPNLNDGPK